MSNYYGDFARGKTVRVRFNTVNSASPPVPTTLSSGSVVVSKDGADVTPSGGVTLVTDAGGVVGRNTVAIDLSADAATFTPGSEYAIRLGGTSNVGGTSVVGIVLGEWSVENRTVGSLPATESLLHRTGTAQAGAVGSITLDAGASGSDNSYLGHTIAIVSGTGSGAIRQVVGYVGATKVATVNRNWSTAPDATSVFVIYRVIGPILDASLAVAANNVGTSPPSGSVVAGSTGASVTVSGLQAGKSFAGQHLYHLPSGESRKIASQTYAGGNYTFAFTGTPTSSDATTGPFTSVATNDAVTPIP